MDYKLAIRFTMPFGKYKDEIMGDIPDSYLEWIVDNIEDPEIVEAARLVLYPPKC